MSFFESFTYRVCNFMTGLLYASAAVVVAGVAFASLIPTAPAGTNILADIIWELGGVNRSLSNAWNHLSRAFSNEEQDNNIRYPLLRR